MDDIHDLIRCVIIAGKLWLSKWNSAQFAWSLLPARGHS